MKVQELSNTPYLGMEHSSWYIEYDQENKIVRLDGQQLSSKVAYDVIKDIKRQLSVPPSEGHHYDVVEYGSCIRIGIQGHNIGISKWDIPRIEIE